MVKTERQKIEERNSKRVLNIVRNEKGKISSYDYLEKWRDGTIRYVERHKAGTKINGKSMGGKYKTVESHRFYQGQKVGVWNKEPQQKIVPQIEHKDYVKGNFYRASISLNVGVNSSKNKPNYRNFTYVVIDEKDNINLKDMHEKLIEGIESREGLHYKRNDFWFDYGFSDCAIQYPKPYSARHEDSFFENSSGN